MLFKSAIVFRFTSPPNIDQEWTDRLAENQFTPVHSSQYSSTGWVPAIPGTDDMIFSANGCSFIRLRKDEKVLKSSAINREVNDKVASIQREQGRRVRKREREAIKDEVIAYHLPHALIDSKYVTGYIDTQERLLVVDASSFKAAEEFASFLRKSLGSLPVRSMAFEWAPGFVLTATLDPAMATTGMAKLFLVSEECTMAGSDNEKATFKDIDLTSDEVTDHITEAGMRVASLRLAKENQLDFTLTEDFIVKKIKFLDGFQRDVLDKEPEDADVAAGVSYARTVLWLMTETLRTTISDLIVSFGGEQESFDPLEDL